MWYGSHANLLWAGNHHSQDVAAAAVYHVLTAFPLYRDFPGLILSVVVQRAAVADVVLVIFNGMKVGTGMEIVDTMLNKGGITSMMTTICTAVLALGLGES